MQNTFGIEMSKAMKHFSFMNEAKVEEIEIKLARNIHDYIDIEKLYEEELEKSYVYGKKIDELD